MQIEGKNQVVEAIKNNATINKLWVDQNYASRKDEVISLARKNKLRVEFLPKKALDAKSVTMHHQGYIAETVDFEYCTVEDILQKAQLHQQAPQQNQQSQGQQSQPDQQIQTQQQAQQIQTQQQHQQAQQVQPQQQLQQAQQIQTQQQQKQRDYSPFVVLLDGIEDPHNLGAIIRTCECAGVDGIIIPKMNAAQVNETVVRTSAGAISHMKIARVANLKTAIDKLKENGLWIYAAELGGADIYSQNLTGPIGIVIGSEGNGVKQSLRTYCDGVITLPQLGSVNSLNASVSAGIVIYEILRQRIKN